MRSTKHSELLGVCFPPVIPRKNINYKVSVDEKEEIVPGEKKYKVEEDDGG